MLLRYTLTIDDFLACNRHVRQVSPEMKRARVRRFWIMPAAIMLMGAGTAILLGSCRWLAAHAALAVFLHVLYRVDLDLLMWRRLRAYYARNNSPLLTGEFTMEIKDEGLRRKTAISESLTFWAGISRVVVTDTHAFIYLGPSPVYIVARNGVLEGDFTRFIRLLEDRLPSSTASVS